MSGLALLGPVAGLALRFPAAALKAGKVASFMKKNWKPFLIGFAVVGACVSAYIYIGHVKKVAYDSGFSTAEGQAKAQVEAANKIAAADQHQLDLMRQRFDLIEPGREQAVTTAVQPQIERITREVQINPVYSQCSISDSVRLDTNAIIAAVNASIGADDPVQSR